VADRYIAGDSRTTAQCSSHRDDANDRHDSTGGQLLDDRPISDVVPQNLLRRRLLTIITGGDVCAGLRLMNVPPRACNGTSIARRIPD
jgi:hypothetical protein